MAESRGFGAQLRSARKQLGMSLDEAGRRLRIEPKVLDTIESMDFANMPPKYMTRSMVNAYAQLVGLNPTATTRQFLDAEFQYQLSRSNGVFDNSQSNNQISTRIASPEVIAAAAETYGTSVSRPTFENGRLPRSTDNVTYRQAAAPVQSSSIDSAWAPGGITRVSAQVASDTGRQRVSANDQDPYGVKRNTRRNADGSIRRPHFTALEDPDVDYGDDDNGAAAMALNPLPKRDYSRLIMIVGCVLAVVLIVVLIKVLFIPEPSTNTIDPTDQAISGLTDPEQAGVSTSTESTINRVAIKPTACYVSIQVGDIEPLLGIYTTDGDFYQGSDIIWSGRSDVSRVMDTTVEAGSRFQYEVTNTMLIRVSASLASEMTVTVNGEVMEPIRYEWFSVWIIDFPEYLEKWEEEHAEDAA